MFYIGNNKKALSLWPKPNPRPAYVFFMRKYFVSIFVFSKKYLYICIEKAKIEIEFFYD